MRVSEGTVYHIRDEYFTLVQGCGVKHKLNNNTYPAYCCRQDTGSPFVWMIPMSTKIEKYKAVSEKEIMRYGNCLSVVIGSFDRRVVAFHIQGMFPITKRYILHPHTRMKEKVPVAPDLREEIRNKFDEMWELHNSGLNCILPDVNRIKKLLTE